MRTGPSTTAAGPRSPSVRPSTTRDQRAPALRDLDEAIPLERGQDRIALARDHLDRARLLVLDHRESDALADCEAAIKANGDEMKAYELRIKLLSGMKRHAEVIRSCDDMISRGWVSPGLIERRGLSRASCNDYPGAIDDYTRLLALRPDRAPLLRARGRLYLVSNDPQRALHDFQDVVRLDPLNGDSYGDRGSALASLGRLTEAVSDAEESLKYGEPSSRRYFVERPDLRPCVRRLRRRGPNEGSGRGGPLGPLPGTSGVPAARGPETSTARRGTIVARTANRPRSGQDPMAPRARVEAGHADRLQAIVRGSAGEMSPGRDPTRRGPRSCRARSES